MSITVVMRADNPEMLEYLLTHWKVVRTYYYGGVLYYVLEWREKDGRNKPRRCALV